MVDIDEHELIFGVLVSKSSSKWNHDNWRGQIGVQYSVTLIFPIHGMCSYRYEVAPFHMRYCRISGTWRTQNSYLLMKLLENVRNPRNRGAVFLRSNPCSNIPLENNTRLPGSGAFCISRRIGIGGFKQRCLAPDCDWVMSAVRSSPLTHRWLHGNEQHLFLAQPCSTHCWSHCSNRFS